MSDQPRKPSEAPTKSCLLIIDVQYDYLPGGEMEVKGGDRVLPQIHRLLDEGNWDLIIASQDHHPPKSNQKPEEEGGGPGTKEEVENATEKEVEIEKELKAKLDKMGVEIVRKGETFNKEDGYSAFASSHPEHSDKSHVAKLLIDNQITHLFICGLATDACVKASANHALEDRQDADIAWDVYLIKEACWGIDDKDSKETLDLMDSKGAKKISMEGDELKEIWKQAVEQK